MAEIEIDGKQFVTGRMSARQQFHVARRLAPLFAAMFPAGKKIDVSSAAEINLTACAEAMARLSDADCDYVLDACLGVVKHREESGSLFGIAVAGGKLRYDWIDMNMMLRLAASVVQDNLQGFMGAVPSSSNGAAIG